MKKVIVVALSGGKDSTAMAIRLSELSPNENYHWVLTPTGNELPVMYEHWRKLKEMLKGKFVPIVADTLEGIIRKNNMIPNFRARFCTRQLKIEPYAAYLLSLSDKYEEVVTCVGIRADEKEREAGDYTKVPNTTMRFPLREWGWKLSEVVNYLKEKNISIPERTDCGLCFFQRLSEWYALWRDHPGEYQKGVDIEEEMGYTFRSDGRDTWPADLKGLRKKFKDGFIPRGVKVQTGLFDETEDHDAIADMKCRVCRL